MFSSGCCDAAGIFRLAHPGAVVLQPAVHVVRSVHVHAHVVELRDREVVGLPPLVGRVVGIPQAAVVARDQVIGVARIDPHVVEVTVRAARDVAVSSVRVRADDQRPVRLVDPVLVLAGRRSGCEVETAARSSPGCGPRASHVWRRRPSRYSPFVGLELRRNAYTDARLGRRDRDRHAAPRPGRQALRTAQLRPGRASVGALEQTAATRRIGAHRPPSGTSTLCDESPTGRRRASSGSWDRAPTSSTRREVRSLEHLHPRLAAVGRLVDTALVRVAPQPARDAHVDRVRLGGIDRDLGNVLGFLENEVVQFSPPSTDLYTPSPMETLLRVHASPVPTHTTFGFLGSMVMAPIDCTGCLSNTGLKVAAAVHRLPHTPARGPRCRQ